MLKTGSKILSSFVGVAIGVVLVLIISPVAAWKAENQHRAQGFADTTRVDPQSLQDGYVVLEGKPEAVGAPTCPVIPPAVQPTDICLAVKTREQTYQASQERYCGTPTNSMTIIKDLGQQCTNGNANCQHCYEVEKTAWQETSHDTDYAAPIKLGAYEITPSDDALLPGSETTTVVYPNSNPQRQPAAAPQVSTGMPSTAEGQYDAAARVGDERTIITTLPLTDQLVVAGNADNGVIRGAEDGQPYVVSTLSYDGTRDYLKNIDLAAKWGLRTGSLLAMMVGILLLFSPLLAITDLARMVPWFGKFIDRGLDGVIKFVLGLIGAAIWAVMFVVIYTVNNLFLLIGLLAIIILAAVWLWRKHRNTPPTASSSTEL